MKFFPKLPGSVGFWRKWNVFCVMFICGCLLATRFYQNSPEIIESAENLMWLGGAGLILGFAMQKFGK